MKYKIGDTIDIKEKIYLTKAGYDAEWVDRLAGRSFKIVGLSSTYYTLSNSLSISEDGIVGLTHFPLNTDYESQEIKEDKTLNTNKPTFKSLLTEVLDEYRDFLLEKDTQYGSFYLNPLNALKTNLTPQQRIKARLEEKLSRLMNGTDDENTLEDILGLLIHLRVVDKMEKG